MGVEYSHGLFVADLAWKPSWAHVEGVHEVMRKWKLAKAALELYDLADGHAEITVAAARKATPANLSAIYSDLEGKAVVDLVGDSQYDIGVADRYIASIEVVFGVDFKVLVNETFEVEITAPARNGKTAIEHDDMATLNDQYVFPASWATTPPKTTVLQGTASDRAFTGVWRTGMMIDCGKDVPRIAENGDLLPAKGFRAALEKALGTELVEVGWYH